LRWRNGDASLTMGVGARRLPSPVAADGDTWPWLGVVRERREAVGMRADL